MAKALMNMDRIVNPRPVSIVCASALERGLFLEIKGMATSGIWGTGDDFEAYKVAKATAETAKGNLLIHSSVPNMYDERLMEEDFELPANKAGRGHYVTVGDEITIPKSFVATNTNVGHFVKLGANGKLDGVVSNSDGKAIGVIVRAYKFNGQDSLMIRFI